MCYPKPGPRCSTHALRKLNAAKKKLNETNPTDVDNFGKAQRNLTLAFNEYSLTTAGIRKFREKAVETGDKKYAVKADKLEAKRKEQLDAYKKSIGADKASSTAKPKLKTDDSSGKQDNLEDKLKQLNKERAALERLHPPENLNDFRIRSVGYEYDSTQCGPDDECSAPDNDYCRDSEYVNLRVEDSNGINVRTTLADIYRCKEDDIPDELETIGREELNLDKEEAYEVESEYGYYGVEGAYVTLFRPFEVKDRLDNYYNEKVKELSLREKALLDSAPKTVKSKRSPSKATSGNVSTTRPTRRGRTDAELDAFEADAMPESSKGKIPVQKKATAPAKPKRRVMTDAKLDAFEEDAMPQSGKGNSSAQKKATAPSRPTRRVKTDAELDAFEAD